VRDITAAMAAEFESRSLMPILIAELEFDSGTLYMWSGVGDLSWNGNTYIGSGNLINISTVEESQNLEAKGIVCSLSGVPSSLISLALTEKTRQRAFRLWLGAINNGDSPRALVDEPYRIFTGLMDVMEISDDGETAIIRLSVESAMITGRRAKIQRYTSEDQKKLYPDDVGLDFIPQLQDKQVVW